MDAIPDPDVLPSGTNQGEFLGEEGQKKTFLTTTELSTAEEKAEHRERDDESDSGNRERNNSSNGGSEDSRPRERECGEESRDGREERDRGRPGGGVETESGTGRRSGKPGDGSTDPGRVLGRARPQQGEFLGEEGQKKTLRTTTELSSAEEKAEHGERDDKSDSGNGERNSSSDSGREDSRPRERDCGDESGDGREERDRGRPGSSVEEESSTGRRGGKPGGGSTDPGHVLGRACPQQVCGAECT
ncbi:hypothetical protein NDU88_002263 [Pleurodeles waltl]|uniref:Uncharacterized protein n=1 Tax=Pleurodeles waltl TaxID=8319 RepID=A0AAV7UWM1_PLEWA|nr:hypothetical protein NDU88_002263 [Pleurodeles waltl]